VEDNLTPEFFTACGVTFLLCVWFLRRELPLSINLGISLLRVTLSIFYFGLYASTSNWHFLDDYRYLNTAKLLIYNGYNPFDILTSQQGISALFMASGGNHLLYRWWNLLAVWLFGSHYYSPCLLNIVLSVIGAIYFRRTLRELGYSERYQKGYLCFFLLQWDIVAWATITNLKEPMMMCFTAAAFYYLVRLTRKVNFHDAFCLAITLILFLFVRFYLPILVITTLSIWILIEWKDKRKYLFVPVMFYLTVKLTQFSGGDTSSFLRPQQLLSGLIRFPLTPQPWQIEPEYSFLLVPSCLHWFLLIPAVSAGFALWKTQSCARLLLCYLIVTMVFFALVPEVQGPRHRVQVTFLIGWLQFHAIYGWVGNYQRRKREILQTTQENAVGRE